MSEAAPVRLGFRADINGLRAIAVLAVIGFHFGVPGFGGGFVGVDVFFVISGYLMTGIILSRLDRGTFSVLGFYLDRARRIIPALLVLILAVLALGWFILLPEEYLILSKHSASSAGFFSNILYWREAGYFDADAHGKWLLHTWSLSVEWQFYLLFPFLLLAVTRFAPRGWWRPILAATALLSFALMIALSFTRPPSGFFLLPPRAWEMLAGSLVYLTPALAGRSARAAQLGGLALIVASAVGVTQVAWPNGWTVLPVLGTALVILAARTESRITGNAVAAWIGLNSYSIYLWHWPAAVLLHRSGHFGEWPWVAGYIAASFALAHLSWRFVERRVQPHTAAPRIHTGRIPAGLIAHARFAVPVGLVVALSLGVWVTRGMPQRFSAEVRAAAAEAAPRPVPGSQACFAAGVGMPERCVLGPAQSPVLATVVGDSHAEAELSGLVAAIPPGAGGIGFAGYASCPPVIGARLARPEGSACADFLRRFLEPLAQPRTTPLILIGSWVTHIEDPTLVFPGGRAEPNAEDFLANLYRSSCKLAAAGPTYIVLPTPHFAFPVANALLLRLQRDPNAAEISIPLAEHEARNRRVIDTLRRAQRECGVKLLDPVPHLCPGGRCYGSMRHRAVIRDRSHVTNFGASLLTPMYAPLFAGARP